MRSDGFLGRLEWGLFGIPWSSMAAFAVVGFRATDASGLKYSHALPGGLKVSIVGPQRPPEGNRVVRGIRELFGIAGAIIRERRQLRDMDVIFSEFREYTFFEILFIKVFARRAKTVVYLIGDFPETNYSRHRNLFFKWLIQLLIILCQWVSDDFWFIAGNLIEKYKIRSTARFGVVRTSNLEEKEIAIRDVPKHIKGDPVRIICVARLEKEKRLDILLRTMELLKEKNVPARLALVGDGAMRRELEERAREMGLGGDVKFPGYIADRAALFARYRESDISLLASAHEGLGLVLVESISQGVPAIANHFEGAEEIIRDGVDGYLIEGGADPEALAQGMAAKIQYLIANPQVYAELSGNGPVAARKFTLEAVNEVQRARWEALLGRTL